MRLKAIHVQAALASLLPLASADCEISMMTPSDTNDHYVQTEELLCKPQGEGDWTFSMRVDSQFPQGAKYSLMIYDHTCTEKGFYTPQTWKGDAGCGAPFVVKADFLEYVLTMKKFDVSLWGSKFQFAYGDGLYSINNNQCDCVERGKGYDARDYCKCKFPIGGHFDHKREIGSADDHGHFNQKRETAPNNCTLGNVVPHMEPGQISGFTKQNDNAPLCIPQGEGQWTFAMSIPDIPRYNGKWNRPYQFMIYDNTCTLMGYYDPGLTDNGRGVSNHKSAQQCEVPFVIEREGILDEVLTVVSVTPVTNGPRFQFKYGDGLYAIANNQCICLRVGGNGSNCRCAFPRDGKFKGKREIAFEG